MIVQLQKGGDIEISKFLVVDVSLREKGSRGKAAAIGGAVGFGAGMAMGVATFSSLDKHGGTGQKIGLSVLFGLVWGGAGALIGTAVGGIRVTNVYRTR